MFPMDSHGDVTTSCIKERIQHATCTMLTQKTAIYSRQLETESTLWCCSYTGTFYLTLDLLVADPFIFENHNITES